MGADLGGGVFMRTGKPGRSNGVANLKRHEPISGGSGDEARAWRVAAAGGARVQAPARRARPPIAWQTAIAGARGASATSGWCRTQLGARHTGYNAVEAEGARFLALGMAAGIQAEAVNPSVCDTGGAQGLFSVSAETRQARRITGEAEPACLLTSGFAAASGRPLAMHGARSATVAAGILTGPWCDCHECA